MNTLHHSQESNEPTGLELESAHFVRKHSLEADAWMEHFLSVTPVGITTRALKSFKLWDFPSGLRDLRLYRRTLLRNNLGESAMLHLGLRWYYTVLAYYYYCAKQFDLAAASMDSAQEAVLRAYEEYHFLLPFLGVCEECLLQKARIERERGRCTEMRSYLEAIAKIYSGECPLCRTRSGQTVYMCDLFAYFRGLANLTQEDMATRRMQAATHPEYSGRISQGLTDSVYMIPGFVNPYGLPHHD